MDLKNRLWRMCEKNICASAHRICAERIYALMENERNSVIFSNWGNNQLQKFLSQKLLKQFERNSQRGGQRGATQWSSLPQPRCRPLPVGQDFWETWTTAVALTNHPIMWHAHCAVRQLNRPPGPGPYSITYLDRGPKRPPSPKGF